MKFSKNNHIKENEIEEEISYLSQYNIKKFINEEKRSKYDEINNKTNKIHKSIDFKNDIKSIDREDYQLIKKLNYNKEYPKSIIEKNKIGLNIIDSSQSENAHYTSKFDNETSSNNRNYLKSSKLLESELDKILQNDSRKFLDINKKYEENEEIILRSHNCSRRSNFSPNNQNVVNNNFMENKNSIINKNIYENNGKNFGSNNNNEINLELETYRSNSINSEKEENSNRNCFSKITDIIKLKKEINIVKEKMKYLEKKKNQYIKKEMNDSESSNNIDNKKKCISLKEIVNQKLKKEILFKNEVFETEKNENLVFPESSQIVYMNVNVLKRNIFENENFDNIKITLNSPDENDNNKSNILINNNERINYFNFLSNSGRKNINPSYLNPNGIRKTKIKKSNSEDSKQIFCTLSQNSAESSKLNDNENINNYLNFSKSNIHNLILNSSNRKSNFFSTVNNSNSNNFFINQEKNNFRNLDLEKDALNLSENLKNQINDKDYDSSINCNSNNKNLKKDVISSGTSPSNCYSNNNNTNNNLNNNSISKPVVITNNYIQLYINNNTNKKIPYLDCLTNKELELREIQNSRNYSNKENSSLDVTPSFKFTDNEFYTNSNSEDFQNNFVNNKNLDLTNTSNIFNNITNNNSQIAQLGDLNNGNNNSNNNEINGNQNNYKENLLMENYIFLKSNNSNKIVKREPVNNKNTNKINDFYPIEINSKSINLKNISSGIQFNNNLNFKDKNNLNNILSVNSNKQTNKQFSILNTQNNVKDNTLCNFNTNYSNNTNNNSNQNKLNNLIINKGSLTANCNGMNNQINNFSGISIIRDLKNIPGKNNFFIIF